ncbi:MAG: chromosomal replication initiator protein DnaA [Desulfobacterota bacterium]|nr:chromosomal replication initiator protein DnaA [Thermodesulfobacteriota bacterium]
MPDTIRVESKDDLWSKVSALLRERIGQQNFDIWIKPVHLRSLEGEKVEVEVPNRFFKEWIQEHYSTQIKEAISFLTQRSFNLQFRIKNEPPPSRAATKGFNASENPLPFTSSPPRSPFNPKYTFENFVVGPGNQFANAACLAVANVPAKNYNPLFIYGGVGLGKTHLLHAIGNHILQHRVIPDLKKICYTSAEEFTNEMINSIRFEKMEEFRNKYRRMDILLIDDIQFIAGKERTQAEFFHTFNSLYEARKQIVVTSDKFPKDIPHFEERLRSRFEWGLIADIQPPDIETKVAILRKKAEIEGIQLPNDVAFFLASQIDSNIRMLEGCLIRIGAFASLSQTHIDLPMAKEVLKNIIKPREESVSIEAIQKVVANHFNLRLSDFKVKRKNKGYVLPRQIAIYLARKMTNLSLIEIGEKFGGKDHSTVLHSIKKVEERMAEDPSFKEKIDHLMSRIPS